MTLKEIRKQKRLTQKECAQYLGVPLRTYQNYENDNKKSDSLKYKYMILQLEQLGYVDETHGLLSISEIKEICYTIFGNSNVEFCYLFGSYAKGQAKETSDIDLLIATSISGIEFYDLIENLRENLKKKVDVLNLDQLKNNWELTSEILRDGIKIYG